MKGLIHVYCGDGKGKTTSAIGLGVRAWGRGKKVMLAQFLKDSNSGERKALEQLSGFYLAPAPEKIKFTFKMTPEEKQEAARDCAKLLEDARSRWNDTDLLILDEVFGSISSGVLTEEQMLEFIGQKPEHLELVMTGRDPSPRMQALADYVTEMTKIKHPFEAGVPARQGIEY